MQLKTVKEGLPVGSTVITVIRNFDVATIRHLQNKKKLIYIPIIGRIHDFKQSKNLTCFSVEYSVRI